MKSSARVLLLVLGLLCVSQPFMKLTVSASGQCSSPPASSSSDSVSNSDEAEVEEATGDEEFGVYVDDVEDEVVEVVDDVASEAAAEESDVLVLTSSNYAKVVNSKEFILVEFYAPWCGHCQALEPEYKAAATRLKAIYGDKVALAKVDGSVHKELADANKVTGLPTIFWFENGVKSSYNGGRKVDSIVSWVKKKLGDAADTLTTKDEAETFFGANPVAVIGYFESFSGPEWEAFVEVAKASDLPFVQTTSADAAAVFGINSPAPAIALVKDEEDKFSLFAGSEYTVEAIAKFVAVSKLQVTFKFSKGESHKIGQSGVKKQLLFFVNEEQEVEFLPVFKKAARSVMGDVIFVQVDSGDAENKDVLKYFGIKDDQRVRLFGFSNEDGKAKSFDFDYEMTLDNIISFAKRFAEGALTPMMKSEEVPEGPNDGPVKVVVAKTFDEIVLDESKDVLLEIYSTSCGHCKSFAPVYERLGKRFGSVESVVIAKIDGSLNEHSRLVFEGFPTILLFKAGDRTAEAVEFTGERDLTSLTKFLKENVSIPFRLVKKVPIEAPVDAAKEEL